MSTLYRLALRCDDIPAFCSSSYDAYLLSTEPALSNIASEYGSMRDDYMQDAVANLVPKDWAGEEPWETDIPSLSCDSRADIVYASQAVLHDIEVSVFNAYDCPSRFHLPILELDIRYVSAFGKYMKLVSYQAHGAYQDDLLDCEKPARISCYGTPVHRKKCGAPPERFDEISDISTVAADFESLAWIRVSDYSGLEEMKNAIANKCKNGHAIMEESEWQPLFECIVGEAG